ncbi:hypothetical protein QUC31_010265 [Theobroma cacao]
MRLSSLRNVKMIFHDQLPAGPLDSQLRELDIKNLPQLKHVWNKDPQGSLTYQNLRKVRVWHCGSLKNLFPASIAKDLPQLEDLTIICCGVEEIVSLGEGLEQPVRFRFPRVSSLELTYLEELKCFYPGQHTIVWPMLKKLKTDCSTFIKIVASERPSIQEMNENDRRESTEGQPLFLGEEVIPQLEELRLSKIDDIAMISDNQFRANFFHPIKVFAGGYHHRYYLELSDTFSELMEIWNRSPQEILNFKNLGHLEVCNCSSLKYIFTPSMALRLRQLWTFKVKECPSMEAVIMEQGVEEEETTDKFTFPHLKSIKIESCSNLTSFYLGSRALKFPNLQVVRIADCPRMSTIASSSSRDKEKEASGDRSEKWDITTTFFSDKTFTSNSVIDEVGDEPQIDQNAQVGDEPQIDQNAQGNNSALFNEKHFVQLHSLSILDCKIMEEIIFMEGLTEDERMSKMWFAQLKFLKLQDLPKLRRFCYETDNEFPFLRELVLTNCLVLKTFISKSAIEDVGDEPQIDQNAQGNDLELDNSALFNEKVIYSLVFPAYHSFVHEFFLLWHFFHLLI